MKNRGDIEVHIEQLVLHGLAVDRHGVEGALRRELARLLAERGVPPAWERSGHQPAVDGGSLEPGTGNDSSATGSGLAQAIHGGLKR